MTQYCGQCFTAIELPEVPGTEVACPKCGATVRAASTYAPSVASGGGVPALPPTPPAASPPSGERPMTSTTPSVPPFPPPAVPPAPAPPPGLNLNPPTATGPTSPPPPTIAADSGNFGLTLDPRWLGWVPLGCLAVALLFSFFSWIEIKLGGYPVLTQNGWQTFAGGKSQLTTTNPELDALEKVLEGKDDTKKLAALRSDALVIPYLLLLLPTVVLAFAERFVSKIDASKLPPAVAWLPKIWHFLPMLLLALCTLLFVLIAVQSWRGFGLQHSIDRLALQKYEAELAENPAETKAREIWIKIGLEANRFSAQSTLWIALVVWLHFAAVLALLAKLWLAMRGAKPLPRLGVSW